MGRKGWPAMVVQAVDSSTVVVRMEDTGNEVSTSWEQVSIGLEASGLCLGAGGRVCLVGLQSRDELNGCHGSIQDFNTEAQRWDVKLDSTGEVIRANPANLSVLVGPPLEPTATPLLAKFEAGARVRLEGLEKKPELNGREGVLVELQGTAGRWNVKLVTDDFRTNGEIISVHVKNLQVLAAP